MRQCSNDPRAYPRNPALLGSYETVLFFRSKYRGQFVRDSLPLQTFTYDNQAAKRIIGPLHECWTHSVCTALSIPIRLLSEFQ